MIEECGSKLKQWNKEVYSVSQNRLSWLLKRLKNVPRMKPSPSVIDELRSVEKDIRLLRQQ